MIDTVFLGPRKGGGLNFLLTMGSFSNKREYSEADWLVPLLCKIMADFYARHMQAIASISNEPLAGLCLPAMIKH